MIVSIITQVIANNFKIEYFQLVFVNNKDTYKNAYKDLIKLSTSNWF